MSATPLTPNIAEIIRSADILFDATQTVELRAFGTYKGSCTGFYHDRDKLAAHAAQISAQSHTPAIFWTLQDVNPKLFGRAPDQFQSHIKSGVATKDADVQRYRWLLVDCDPLRNPAKISSTDAEKADALEVATAVRGYFDGINAWDEGYASILADSGNGYHVLLRVDMEVSETSKALYQRVLQSLGQQFSTGDATSGTKIDTSVFNPSRICKVYGTPVRKGSETPERPHRMAQLLDVPDTLPIVPVDVLKKIAAEFTPATAATSAAHTPAASAMPSRITLEAQALKMEQFLAEAKYMHRQRADYDNGGFKWQLMQCPFNAEHSAPDSYAFLKADGKMGFHCSHNHCVDNKWTQFRAKAEAGIGHRFQFVEPSPRPSQIADYTKTGESRKSEHPILQAARESAKQFDMESILFNPTATHAKHIPILDGFLTESESAILIGAVKAEKSLFGLRLAMHVACGKAWCGYASTHPRRVAYLDGENDPPDVADRYNTIIEEFSFEERKLIVQNLVVIWGRQYTDAGGTLDYLNDQWWDAYAKQTKDCEVHFLDCLYLFHDKEPFDNNGLREVMQVLRYRIHSMGPRHTAIVLHHSRSMSNDDLRGVEKLSLEKLGAYNFSEKSYGGKVVLKDATLVICMDRHVLKDADDEVEAQEIHFQFYGRRVPPSPLLKFDNADGKFARRLIRTLSKGARKSVLDLQLAHGDAGFWESRHEAAKDLKCVRSNAYRHLDEMIAKEYLVQDGAGHLHLHLTAELTIELSRVEEHKTAHDAAEKWLRQYVTQPMKAENVIEVGDEQDHARDVLIEARVSAGLIEEAVTDAANNSTLMWRPKKKRGGFRKGSLVSQKANEKRWAQEKGQQEMPGFATVGAEPSGSSEMEIR
jgi:hypothetical protein